MTDPSQNQIPPHIKMYLKLLLVFSIALILSSVLATIATALTSQVFFFVLLAIVASLFGNVATIINMLVFIISLDPTSVNHIFPFLPQRLKPMLNRFVKGLLAILRRRAIRAFAIIVLSLVLVFVVLRFTAVNESFCLKAVSHPIFCGSALGTETITVSTAKGNEQLKIGLIDKADDSPFTLTGDITEKSIEKMIFDANNQAVSSGSYITLALVTMLSTTTDDPSSALVGQEDVKGVALAQRDYNKAPNHTVKLRIVIGNIGTQNAASTTVSLVMKRLALLSKQDTTFRGIIGFPFSSSAALALQTRDMLGVSSLPLITPTATSTELDGFTNFYRIPSPDPTQACVLLGLIENHLIPALQADYTKRNLTQDFKIAIFSDGEDKYSNSLAVSFEKDVTGTARCDSYGKFPVTHIDLIPEPYTVGDQSLSMSSRIDDAIQYQMDMIFFSGYSTDLANFANQLDHEQKRLHYTPTHLVIVGGDGLFEINGLGIKQTVYGSVYTPLLDTTNPYAKEYTDLFGTTTTISVQGKTLFPFSAILSYDATNAFLDVFRERNDAGTVPSQEKFDEALGHVGFNGLSGYIQFSQGSTDPLNKTIYVFCSGETTPPLEAFALTPGQKPSESPPLLTDWLNCASPTS